MATYVVKSRNNIGWYLGQLDWFEEGQVNARRFTSKTKAQRAAKTWKTKPQVVRLRRKAVGYTVRIVYANGAQEYVAAPGVEPYWRSDTWVFRDREEAFAEKKRGSRFRHVIRVVRKAGAK